MNKDKIFYVIRPNGTTEGLLSSYLSVLRQTNYAQENNYIPIVDYMNYENQYNNNQYNNQRINSWELFFNQLTNYSLEEVYKSKNVILSGWTIESILYNQFEETFTEKINYYKSINFKISINKEISKMVENVTENYVDEKTLGVFIRGTDYASLKPKNHHKQPSVEMLLEKTNEYIEKYDIKNIFLVTEDIMIEKNIKKELKVPVKMYGENVITSYNGSDYISNFISNQVAYDNAVNYLIRMMLLSKCRYLISSITSATYFLMSLENVDYIDVYFFDIGKYK